MAMPMYPSVHSVSFREGEKSEKRTLLDGRLDEVVKRLRLQIGWLPL